MSSRPAQNSAAAAAFFYPALDRLGDGGPDVVPRVAPTAPPPGCSCCSCSPPTASRSSTCCAASSAHGALTGPYLFAEFASLAFVGAAALHPVDGLSRRAARPDLRPIGRRRILALTAALLVNPATLAIEVFGGRQIDPAPYLIGGALIGVLVIARLGDALRQLGDSLRERESLDGAAPPPGAVRRADLAAQPEPLHGAA